MLGGKNEKILSFHALQGYISKMEFSKENIVSRPFSKKFVGGLDEFEVRDFLHVLSEEIKRLSEHNALYQKTIQEQKALIQDYKDREHILREAIAGAEKWAQKIRKDAENNSSLILEKAQNKSEGMIQEAGRALQTVYNDITDLKRLHLQYKTGLKAALQVQMDLLEQEPVYSPGLDSAPAQGALEGGPSLAAHQKEPSSKPQPHPSSLYVAPSGQNPSEGIKASMDPEQGAGAAYQPNVSITEMAGAHKEPAPSHSKGGAVDEGGALMSEAVNQEGTALSPEDSAFQTAEKEISSLRESLKSIDKDFS